MASQKKLKKYHAESKRLGRIEERLVDNPTFKDVLVDPMFQQKGYNLKKLAHNIIPSVTPIYSVRLNSGKIRLILHPLDLHNIVLVDTSFEHYNDIGGKQYEI